MAIKLQQILLCRLQSAVGPILSKRSSGAVQQVDVRQPGQGSFDPGKPVAGREQRYIEAFPVKAHQMAGAAHPSERVRQHRRLSRERRQEILADVHDVLFNPSEPKYKGDGPGTTSKARGFGVDKEQLVALGLFSTGKKVQGNFMNVTKRNATVRG